MGEKGYLPGEKGSTVTSVFSGATGLGMSFPVRLNSIAFRAFVTFPFFLTVLSAKVFLDSGKVTECPRGVVVYATCFWAHVHLFPYLFTASLLEFPWKVVSSPVKLKILVSLKPFVTYFTHESICCH